MRMKNHLRLLLADLLSSGRLGRLEGLVEALVLRSNP